MRLCRTSCFALAAATCGLIGCSAVGVVPNISTTPSPAVAAKVSGSVHGGQQPISGATIQLYAVGTTGDGSAPTALLTSTVQTGPTGGFSINNLYTCPAGDPLVYITATGGNPGLPSGTNSAITMMAALGACSSLSSSTFIQMNEVTTVAAAAALAPFITAPFNIGSSPADATALAAAFNTAAAFADFTTGTSPGAGQSATPTTFGQGIPVTTINTLANVLAACVNSPGGTVSDTSTPCGMLFSLTGSPTDTASAVIALEKAPAAYNTAGIFALASPTAPFQPQLSTAPNGSFGIAVITPNGGSPHIMTIPSTVYPGAALWIVSTTPDCLYQFPSLIQLNGSLYASGGTQGCARIYGIVPTGLPYGIVSGQMFTSSGGTNYNINYPFYVNVVPKPDTSLAFSLTTLYWIGTEGVQDYEQDTDVVNNTNATITLGTPTFADSGLSGFTLDTANSTCTSTLPAGSSCHLYVSFFPHSAGIVTTTLNISGNNGTFNATAVLAGSGMN
jgi:hypothetical protein